MPAGQIGLCGRSAQQSPSYGGYTLNVHCSVFLRRLTMKAYRLEKRIGASGSLHLHALPFTEGQQVEVIVRPREKPAQAPERPSLQGAVKKYVAPTEPVASEAWEAAR